MTSDEDEDQATEMQRRLQDRSRIGLDRRSVIPPSRHPPPIGLLAGSGRFPIVFAEKARQLGMPVVCVGIRHEAPPELAGWSTASTGPASPGWAA